MKRSEKLKEQIIGTAPSLSSERARLITDFYKKTEGMSVFSRRAQALAEILSKKSIYILDEELVVGNQSVRPRGTEIFPEFSVDWVLEELDHFALRDSDAFTIDEATKEELRECLPWWRGKTTRDQALALMSAESLQAHQELVYILTSLGSGVGHLSVNYQDAIRYGLRSVIQRVQALLEGEDKSDSAAEEGRDFRQGVITVLEAAIAYARRFADLADSLAAGEEDPRRKGELIEIARICRKVPEFPAETFHEAVQSFWFVHLILQIESNGHSISPGRFDYYMYPFYRDDLAAGRVTRSFAKEILESLWFKMNEIIKVRDWTGSKAFGGYPMFQNLIVGGVDEDGRDSSNELSFLCMEVTRELKLPQPSFSVRWHPGVSRDYMREAVEVVQAGFGMPAFFNDEVIIPIMRGLGYTEAEAWDYAEVGCVEPQAAGTTEGYYPSGFLNLGKVLELCLWNGINPISGKQIGLSTGDSFPNFDSFYGAFKEQLAYFCRLQADAINLIDQVQGQLVPVPFCSAFVADCIEEGKDIRRGGARYNFSSPNAVALANAADALTVLRDGVFRDRILSYQELRQVLATDFEGNENLRQRFLNGYPKYGNDEDEVDFFARDIAQFLSETFAAIPNVRGGKFTVGLQSISAHALFVNSIGATPDGRKAAMLLADGGCSPAQGRDRRGPTAVMRSVAKIDHYGIPNGTLLNIKLHPSLVETENGRESLIALIESYFTMKGQHVQFNVVGAETLRRARENPEDYRDLVVRVAGFSVYFTAIDEILQEDIIRRTEQQVY